MKTEKIDFDVVLKNAFGKVVKERLKDGEEIELKINTSIVNILAHPVSLGETPNLTGMDMLSRLHLMEKVAAGGLQEYDAKELAMIEKAVITLFNKKMLSLELAGTILKMIE